MLGAIVLALIFFVLRPMIEPPAGARARRADRAARARRRAARAAAPQPADDILDLPAQTVNKIERLRDVIASRGEDSAAVLRSWIESPDSPQGARRIMSVYPPRDLRPDRRRRAPRVDPPSAGSRRCARRPTHEGFLAGQAMATEAFLEEESRLTSELVEAIADARLTNEAARRHVAASLAPMVEALAEAIAPALAEAGLGAEIARIVERALVARARGAAAAALRARGRRRGCAALLAAPRAATPRVEEAPELLPREAQIFWDQGYDHLDLDACIAQIRACIASHLEPAARARTMTPDNTDDEPASAGPAAAARRSAARRPPEPVRGRPAPAPSSACRSR